VRWGGKESIDHPQGAAYHDDCANALAGAAVLASLKRQPLQFSDDFVRNAAIPGYWKRFTNNAPNRPVSDSDHSHVIGRFRAGSF
jgi:hypothetical protein